MAVSWSALFLILFRREITHALSSVWNFYFSSNSVYKSFLNCWSSYNHLFQHTFSVFLLSEHLLVIFSAFFSTTDYRLVIFSCFYPGFIRLINSGDQFTNCLFIHWIIIFKEQNNCYDLKDITFQFHVFFIILFFIFLSVCIITLYCVIQCIVLSLNWMEFIIQLNLVIE